MAQCKMSSTPASVEPWPSLDYGAWGDTAQTVHMWCQIVGKVRLSLMPWQNHSWHVTLYVTPRGLTTGAMPIDTRTLEIAFDFLEHKLRIDVSDREFREIPLGPRTVSSFYEELMDHLRAIGSPVSFSILPNEVEDPIPFDRDETHAAYDPEYAGRFSQILNSSYRVFNRFRAGFLGKCSPVHFFWGSFDLAVTRFSGRRAPEHPGGVVGLPDWVTREAYSHEVSSAGFWPGSDKAPPMFYSYAYPTPDGFSEALVRPEPARFDRDLGEFVLPYDAVRDSSSPDAALASFLESTYAAAADLAGWDRNALEFTEQLPPATTSHRFRNG